MVIYRHADAVWLPVINEKSQCRLGEGISVERRIQPHRMQEALDCLSRFRAILDLVQPDQCVAIATAAVREADNGPDLVRDASQILGFEPQILSGRQEASHAANGVLWMNPNANGLVADLGGSSLELCAIRDGQVQHDTATSMVIGPLQLFDLFGGNRKKAKAHIDGQLRAALPPLQSQLLSLGQGQGQGQEQQQPRLYLVGGAWRALASLHIEHLNHPLKLVHRYSPQVQGLDSFLRAISFMDRDQALELAISQPDRRIALPYAALVLRRLLKSSAAQRVEFSAAGIREGALAKCLTHGAPQSDTNRYLSAVRSLVRQGGRFGPIGNQIYDWIKPALEANLGGITSLPSARIIEACHLGDLGWDEHPSHKKTQTHSSILHSAVLPHDHLERTQLATVQYYRHKGRSADATAIGLEHLLEPSDHQACKVLGRLIQLCMQLCRARAEILAQTHLSFDEDTLTITCPNTWGSISATGIKTAAQLLADCAGTRVRFA